MDQAWLKISDAKNDTESGKDKQVVGLSVARGRRRSSSKRGEILQVAREQFLANGYDGTSIDSIVDIIGGSKSTIYSHFGNKELLFAAVIKDTGHTPDAPDFPLINGNVRDELVAFAENRLRRVLSPLNIGIMRIVIAEAQRLPQIAELFYRNAPEPTYVSLKAHLQVAVARKQLAIDDIEEAADLFIGGLIQRHLLARLFCVENALSAADIRAKAERVVDIFVSKHSPATV